MQNITGESDLTDLTILGQAAQPARTLETFPNHHPARDYKVTLTTNEFTCLCPKTGQPDFANITISYIPDKSLIESKSLKLYLASFRNEGAFHEHITNAILDDLEKTLAPRWCKVTAEFASRGGIAITIAAEFGKASTTPFLPVVPPVRTEAKNSSEEPPMTETRRYPAASPRWDKKPTDWERKTPTRNNYGKPSAENRFEQMQPYHTDGEARPYKRPYENRFERGKPTRTDGTARLYKRQDSPARTEEKPNWEKKKSERRTTKTLGGTRTWRKRT